MKCPNCSNIIDANTRFCPFCSFNVEKHNKGKVKRDLIALVIFFIVLFVGELVYNYYYEQKMGKPFSYSMSKKDVQVTVSGNYDKSNKTVNINLSTDQIIEPWQIELQGKEKLVFYLLLNTEKGEKEIEYNSVNFVANQALSATYKIENISFKGFAEIKKIISETTPEKNNFKIRHSNVIDFSKSSRNALKKEYLAWKEEQRQLKLQREREEREREIARQRARQLLYNYYTYGMYY